MEKLYYMDDGQGGKFIVKEKNLKELLAQYQEYELYHIRFKAVDLNPYWEIGDGSWLNMDAEDYI